VSSIPLHTTLYTRRRRHGDGPLRAVRAGLLASRRMEAGIGLIETMLALSLGVLVLLAAIAALTACRATYRALENMSRLQDAARLATQTVLDDLRLAGYYGLDPDPHDIGNIAGAGQPAPAAFSTAQHARIDYCGGASSHWAIDLAAPVAGSNDVYGLACAAVYGARIGSDVLVVRHASEAEVSTLDANRLHLQSRHTHAVVFMPLSGCSNPAVAACLPTGFEPATSQTHTLITRAYYIANGSTQRSDVPALRRKTFGNINALAVADAITDEEIVAGVEDLQLRFGYDTDGDGAIDRWLPPGTAPAAARPHSVTLWLRLRSEEPEPGHVDDHRYQYADMTTAWQPNDRYRRWLVARTVQLRNSPS